MHRIFISLLLFFTSLSVIAQSSKEVLAAMTDSLNKYSCAKIDFEFTASKASGEVVGNEKGVFISQANSFKIEAPMLHVYCDGKSKWIFDLNNQEVTILPNDPSTSDITDNPFALLKAVDTRFRFEKRPQKITLDGGTEAFKIVLSPLDKKISYTSVELIINSATHLPASIKYISKNGENYYAKILTFLTEEPKPEEFFILNTDTLNNAIITDLR